MQAFLKGPGGAPPAKKPAPAPAPGTSKKDGKPVKKHIPWVEKYRPRTVDDVAHQDEVVAVLRKTLEGSDLPNLLFYGPPGTGKTSTILAAARALYGHDLYKDRVLELNASDERGISVVREKVKKFSQLTASATRPDGKPCPPYKIIILDEADSMTSPAQAALRRTMEKETKTTRFCLICNYVTRIIEPITSRCAKFRFKPLGVGVMSERLKHICQEENVKIEEEAIQTLMQISEGDMRKAVMFLQSASRLCGQDGSVNSQIIRDITGVVPEDLLDEVLKVCRSDSYEKLDATVKKVIREGYAGSQILSQFHDKLVAMEEVSDKQKSVICEKMALVDKCLLDGADEYLQLMALFSTVMHQMCHAE
ncbi:replication factor C subunit 4-like [Littorina saxatilis]|uniref:Replication factor C subunit 4 n=1 Tax=Littorina saxatilis TaxID=31220 RepID=A0AAN9G0F9_9CAEN